MRRRFLDEEIVKVSEAADAVVTLKDDDAAVEDPADHIQQRAAD